MVKIKIISNYYCYERRGKKNRKIIYSCRLCGVEDIVVVKRGSFVCPGGSGAAAVGGDAGE